MQNSAFFFILFSFHLNIVLEKESRQNKSFFLFSFNVVGFIIFFIVGYFWEKNVFCDGAQLVSRRRFFFFFLTKMSSGFRSTRHRHLQAVPPRTSESDLIVSQFGFKKNFTVGSTVGFIVFIS